VEVCGEEWLIARGKKIKGKNLETTIWGVTDDIDRNGGGREKSGRRGSVGIGLGEKENSEKSSSSKSK
jgi:hypothetical protein